MSSSTSPWISWTKSPSLPVVSMALNPRGFIHDPKFQHRPSPLCGPPLRARREHVTGHTRAASPRRWHHREARPQLLFLLTEESSRPSWSDATPGELPPSANRRR